MAQDLYKYIWKSFSEGNTKAFADLYELYAEDLFLYGLTIVNNEELVKDLIQELFIEIWDNRTKLSYVDYPKTYLLKAIYYKILRSSKKKSQPIDDQMIQRTEPSIEVAWILKEIQHEQIENLKSQLQLLPERQRQVLQLKYFQNLSSQQIGEILSINTQSVSNLIYRGISTLRKKILKKK